MTDVCEYAIGTDARGLAIVCGEPAATSRFAFCAAHLQPLVVKARTAFNERQAPAAGEER